MMNNPAPDIPRILSDDECEALTKLKKKQRWKMEAAGTFPRRIPLAPRITGYLESEILEWISERAAERDQSLAQRRSPNPLARENRKALRSAS